MDQSYSLCLSFFVVRLIRIRISNSAQLHCFGFISFSFFVLSFRVLELWFMFRDTFGFYCVFGVTVYSM